ncbi:MAG: UpxY family transcription antiterminator [Duncaniella sp.]|nr:UpxY family transcription antiterminator [Duncaniella sp.]
MCTDADNKGVATVPHGVGGAEGVGKREWFVAIVNNNTEKASQKQLDEMGYETYVAKQLVMRVWKNGRKAKVDKVIIPSVIFIKCTEEERRRVVTLPFVKRFMTNKARTSTEGLNKPIATIPQKQIDTLRFMLGQSDIPVDFVETPIRVHDKVIVTRGNLKGMEGEVIQTEDGKSEVIVRIDLLGSAKLSIDTINLEIQK